MAFPSSHAIGNDADVPNSKAAQTTPTRMEIVGSRTKPLTITEGKTTSLSLGKDIVVSIVTKISKGKVQFTVEQTAADGWQITGIYRAGGKRLQPPQVEVIDKAGKVIHLAKLEYG